MILLSVSIKFSLFVCKKRKCTRVFNRLTLTYGISFLAGGLFCLISCWVRVSLHNLRNLNGVKEISLTNDFLIILELEKQHSFLFFFCLLSHLLISRIDVTNIYIQVRGPLFCNAWLLGVSSKISFTINFYLVNHSRTWKI